MSRPRVYMGRLSPRAREYEVEKFFQGYGKIRDIMLKNGYGFVEFEDYKDADDAIQDLNGRTLCGERVMLEIAKGTPRGAGGAFVSGYTAPPPNVQYYTRGGSGGGGGRPGYGRPQNGYKLIVENLSTRCTWQDLKDMMKTYGEILYADAHHYRRNEGVVEFAKRSDMEYAVDKLEGKEINGRRIKLIPEATRYSRSPSPVKRHDSRERSSRRRSRSRSGSRHRSSTSRSHGKKVQRSRSRSGSASPKKAARSPSKESNDSRCSSPPRKGSPADNNGYRSRSRTGSPDPREYRSRSRS